MNVLFDHQAFQFQRYGGVSKYFTNIIKHLPDEARYEISVLYSDNHHLKESNLTPGISSITGKISLPERKRNNSIIGRIENKIRKDKIKQLHNKNLENSVNNIKLQDFDVFHPTYFDTYFLDYMGRKPFVITVHDMTHELYPEYFQFDPELFLRKEKLIRAANHIIAVSDNTRKDIISLLNIDPQKISVVYHASELSGPDEETEIFSNKLPERYLLFVGDRNGYKNFWFFIHAIRDLFKKYNDLKLICTGAPFTANEIQLFNALAINEKVRSVFVNESMLYSLYNRAEAFVFPSQNEGFGIPVLEAFQSGCPALLSNSSCFPEIAGDAAIYFDPRNRGEIQNTIEEILNNPELRTSLINKGKERLKLFSWKNSSDQTTNIYKKLL